MGDEENEKKKRRKLLEKLGKEVNLDIDKGDLVDITNLSKKELKELMEED